ncbi:VanZ family protein [Oceanobacillus sp. CAU 1775]
MSKNIIFSFIISQLIFLLCLPFFLDLFLYLHPIVIVVLWMCLTAFICFILLLFWKQTITVPRYILMILLLAYSVCLLILLFFRPNEQTYENYNLIPFSTISIFLSGNVSFLVSFYNLAANIGLFIPFGIALMLTVQSWPLRILIPILAISGIELTQFLTKRGSLDIDDLILNLLGVCIGFLLTPLFLRVIKIK